MRALILIVACIVGTSAWAGGSCCPSSKAAKKTVTKSTSQTVALKAAAAAAEAGLVAKVDTKDAATAEAKTVGDKACPAGEKAGYDCSKAKCTDKASCPSKGEAKDCSGEKCEGKDCKKDGKSA